ncbi:MAG: hypothetical protein KBF17_00940 [Candidatus Promineofilum sp.]|nr:hypothetical protein [Promineifilum sp.]
MITYQDIIVAVRQLPNEKRLTLMEELVHLMAAEWQPPQTGESSLARVRGMLKPDGPLPSEHELREGYTDYLIEKYN